MLQLRDVLTSEKHMKNNTINIEIDLDAVTDAELDYLDERAHQNHISLEDYLVCIIKEHLTQNINALHYS